MIFFLNSNYPSLPSKSIANKQRHNNDMSTLPVVVGGNAVADDDSCSDVLIIEAPKTIAQTTHIKLNGLGSCEKPCAVLTEELMKEHHKTHDTGTGNGTFSQFTRDYIVKWILEIGAPSGERPFEAGEIPIESFGVKVLNDPQYLIVKTRQESAQAASSAILARQNTAVAYVGAKDR